VLIADDLPVDEAARDELLENFQATYHGGDGRKRLADSEDVDLGLDEETDDEEELEPDEDDGAPAYDEDE
jgi:hypothetical protein